MSGPQERVLIFGSRTWTDPRPIFDVVKSLSTGSTVLVGGAKGADHLAESYALGREDLVVEVFPAEWDRYGKAAGPMRNIQMADAKPTRAYGFMLGDSPGSSHMAGLCRSRNIPLELDRRDEPPRIQPGQMVWIEDGDEECY